MYDLSGAGPVTWLEFPDPEYNDVDHKIRVNLSFLASNWSCQYGHGCPGLFGPESKHTFPDIGCCCVDDQTEALTKRGWVSGGDLRESDSILSLDPTDGHLKWSSIKSIFRKDYVGRMHRLTAIGLDALVTPNHKWAVERYLDRSTMNLIPTERLKNRHRLVLSGKPVDGPDVYTDAFVELVGWAVTEGHYRSYARKRDGGETHWVRIYQRADKPECDRIRQALKSVNADWAEGTSRNCTVFSIKGEVADLIFTVSPGRVMTYDFMLAIDANQRELLIETMILADGWIDRVWGHRSYAQKDKNHVDSFVALCAMAGVRTVTTLRHLQPRDIEGAHVGAGACYYVSLIKSSGTSVGYSLDMHGGHVKGVADNVPTVPYRGLVWCPETEYGTFMARRNGHVYITGNTHGFVPCDDQEVQDIDDRIKMLTDADWDKDLRAEFEARGTWFTGKGTNRNSIVVDGGCIFANRTGGSSGKPGCAFLHLGNRVNKGKNNIGDNSEEHETFMPKVCWMLPLYMIYPDEYTTVLTAWSTSMWTEGEATDENYESKDTHWWCIDSVSSYNGRRMVVDSMQREITKLLGVKSYDIIRQAIGDGSGVMPMPASPAGRKVMQLLPMRTIEDQVGSRTPMRT